MKKHCSGEVIGKAMMAKCVENPGPDERRTTQSLDYLKLKRQTTQ